MRAQDSHTFFHGFFTDNVHSQAFSHIVGIYFISRLQALAIFNHFIQIAVSGCFCLLYHFSHTFPLCLAGAHKGFIFFAKIKNFCFVTVFFPSVFCFHFILPPVFSVLSRFYYNFLLIARQVLILPPASIIIMLLFNALNK